MNLSDVFTTPFKLVYSHIFTDPTLSLRVKLKTDNIHDKTTKEEIYILSKMYIDLLIQRYKNYIIQEQPITESSYKLCVELVEDDELKYKHIYSCFYNNREDRISWENKYDDNFDIEGEFLVSIEIIAYVFTDYHSNDENEDEDQIKRSITESECIICYENKPNMLFIECMHLCVCNVCNSKGRFNKCPLCRTKIKNQKIRII